MSACCEPVVFSDGSTSHADDCPNYPWCPHEVGAYVCGVPCGCPCSPCAALSPAPSPQTTDRRQK